MSEWKEVRLGDVCEILDSKRVPLSAIQRKQRQGPYPYYGAQNIIDHVDDYLLDGEYLLVAEDGANLVTRTQNIANLVSGKIWVNNHAHILGYNGKCPLNLLGFILNKSNISPYVTGCAQPKLNQDNLRRISINLPKKVDEIASILSSLDDKIAVNRRICENLEAQAQALFKHWFIDFAPFKDGKFVESELGMIPEGWRVYRFPDFISPSSDKVREEGIPEYSVTNTGIHPRDEKFRKNLSKTSSTNKLLRKNDLVFGMSREILNWGVMEDEKGGVSPAYQIYRVDQSKVDSIYLKEYISHKINYFRDLIKASTREGQSLDKGALFNKLIYIPPKSILSGFFSIWNVLKVEITTLQQENLRLSTLRDTLLPKLMSGQIKV